MNPGNPLVSVIIPTYNRAEVIGETLQSVKNQTYQNWECIIVDDGSDDNTEELIENLSQKDSRYKFFKRDKAPKGGPACRNIGIENAKGEFIIFLDSDDFLANFCLELRVQFMKDFPQLDFAVFQMKYYEEEPNSNEELITKERKNYLFSFLRHDLPWCITSPIWKTEILIRLKGFKLNYPRLQDPELHTRALMIPNIHFKVLPDARPDAFYKPTFGRKDLKKGLTGFFFYLKDFSTLELDSVSKHQILGELKGCLNESEKFLITNYARSKMWSAFILRMKIQLVCRGAQITNNKEFCKSLLYYFYFNIISLFDLKKAKSQYLNRLNLR